MTRVSAKGTFVIWGFDGVQADPVAWSRILEAIGARPDPKWKQDGKCFTWLGRGIVLMTEFNPLTGSNGPGGPNERNKGKAGTVGISGTEDGVRAAVRAIRQNAKFTADTPGRLAIGRTEMKTIVTAEAHHFFDGKNYYADTSFLNATKGIWPGATLEHLGFGEFYLKTPDGDIQFDRMRGEDFPGQEGRSHQLHDGKGGKLVEKLIKLMESKHKSELVKGASSFQGPVKTKSAILNLAKKLRAAGHADAAKLIERNPEAILARPPEVKKMQDLLGNSQASSTVRALKVAAELFYRGMTDEAVKVIQAAFDASAQKKKVGPHMWVLSKDSAGGYLVTIGDPHSPGSKIKQRFSGQGAKQNLTEWVRDSLGRAVSPNHVIDMTGLRLVSDNQIPMGAEVQAGPGQKLDPDKGQWVLDDITRNHLKSTVENIMDGAKNIISKHIPKGDLTQINYRFGVMANLIAIALRAAKSKHADELRRVADAIMSDRLKY